jgi:DNA-binding NtrC family response regulator
MPKKSPSPRVLVVDDEPLIRWSLSETLAERGLQVTEAADGRSAIAEVEHAVPPFDAVLLDLRLPDVNDLSLLASVRHSSPRSRVILMTAFGTPEVLQEARDLGVFRVVNKPFEVGDLADLVTGADLAP